MTIELTPEQILRQRVWTLRPALAQAIRTLRDVHTQYEGSHEAGHIQMVIDNCERVLDETSGPTARRSDMGAMSQ